MTSWILWPIQTDKQSAIESWLAVEIRDRS